MASYISVPRDLTKVKSKVFFNLTKRQLICFSLAALIGVPSFFLLKKLGNISLAALGMMAVMMPLFFFAMYEKNGEPLEVILFHFIEAQIIRPKIRVYRTDNDYAALMRQAQAEKEVEEIVRKYQRPVPEKGKKKLPGAGVSEKRG
jgi:hypothetical protein